MALHCSEGAGPSDSEADAISPSSPQKTRYSLLSALCSVCTVSVLQRTSSWRSFLARPLPLGSCRMRCSASVILPLFHFCVILSPRHDSCLLLCCGPQQSNSSHVPLGAL